MQINEACYFKIETSLKINTNLITLVTLFGQGCFQKYIHQLLVHKCGFVRKLFLISRSLLIRVLTCPDGSFTVLLSVLVFLCQLFLVGKIFVDVKFFPLMTTSGGRNCGSYQFDGNCFELIPFQKKSWYWSLQKLIKNIPQETLVVKTKQEKNKTKNQNKRTCTMT